MGIQRPGVEQVQVRQEAAAQRQMQAVTVGTGGRFPAAAEVVAEVMPDGGGGHRCDAPQRDVEDDIARCGGIEVFTRRYCHFQQEQQGQE